MATCDFAIRSEASPTGWACAAWVRGYCVYMRTLAEERDGKRGRIIVAECWEGKDEQDGTETN